MKRTTALRVGFVIGIALGILLCIAFLAVVG
jgi:hypothetical protein